LRKVANRQTNRQTNKQTYNNDYISSLAEVINRNFDRVERKKDR